LNGYVDSTLLYGFYVGTTDWMTGLIDGASIDKSTPVTSLGDQWSMANLIVDGSTKISKSSLNGKQQARIERHGAVRTGGHRCTGHQQTHGHKPGQA
jgi:hypothetical protein